ncbi:MAG: hypothetical protein ABI583_01280 [Betaproteobacteria bacterium]
MQLRSVYWGMLLIGFVTSVGAQGNGERPHGPPPEAVAACKGLASAATCSFVGRQGENMTGTCFKPSAGGQGKPSGAGVTPLACRPDRGGPGADGKRPPPDGAKGPG